MVGSFIHLNGICVYEVAATGSELRTGTDAVDLMSTASEGHAQWIAIPLCRLGEDFFELRTRVAGEMVQKFAVYGARVAIVGDISERTAASKSLAAFVAEANRSENLCFVESLSRLRDRFAESDQDE